MNIRPLDTEQGRTQKRALERTPMPGNLENSVLENEMRIDELLGDVRSPLKNKDKIKQTKENQTQGNPTTALAGRIYSKLLCLEMDLLSYIHWPSFKMAKC